MKEKPLKITVGTDSFKKLVTTSSVFVDKTLFIKEIIDSGMEAILITRPRRWGKTLGLDMLKTFFSIEVDENGTKLEENPNKALFAGGEVTIISPLSGDKEVITVPKSKLTERDSGAYLRPQGQYPVIFISFKDVTGASYQEVENALKTALRDLFSNYRYLKGKIEKDESDRIQKYIEKNIDKEDIKESIYFLSQLLFKYHGKKNKVYILIDEYDKPVNHFLALGLTQGIKDRGDVAELMTSIMSKCGKGNIYLEKIILTGILDALQKSDSGFNNDMVFSISDARFGNSFGFSVGEVDSLVDKLGFDATKAAKVKQDIKDWYNGYTIPVSATESIQAYTPWPVMAYLAEVYDGKIAEPKSYWAKSGINEMLDHISSEGTPSGLLDKLKSLSEGSKVRLTLDDDFSLFSALKSTTQVEDIMIYLLLSGGYITKSGEDFVIPNREIEHAFKKRVIKAWLEKETGLRGLTGKDDILKQLSESLPDSGEFKKKAQGLILDKVGAGDKTENYFQSLVGGIIELYALYNGDVATHHVLSEKTVISGRIDNIFYPTELKGSGPSHSVIIHEYKMIDKTALGELEKVLNEALCQILERMYLIEPLSKKDAHPHHTWSAIKIRSVVFIRDESGGKWSVDVAEKELTVDQAKMVALFFSDELVRAELGLHKPKASKPEGQPKTRKPEDSRIKFLSILNEASTASGGSTKFDNLAELLNLPAITYGTLLKYIMQHKVGSLLKNKTPTRLDAVLGHITADPALGAAAISSRVQTELAEKIDAATMKLLLDCEKRRVAFNTIMPAAAAADSPVSSVGIASPARLGGTATAATAWTSDSPYGGAAVAESVSRSPCDGGAAAGSASAASVTLPSLLGQRQREGDDERSAHKRRRQDPKPDSLQAEQPLAMESLPHMVSDARGAEGDEPVSTSAASGATTAAVSGPLAAGDHEGGATAGQDSVVGYCFIQYDNPLLNSYVGTQLLRRAYDLGGIDLYNTVSDFGLRNKDVAAKYLLHTVNQTLGKLEASQQAGCQVIHEMLSDFSVTVVKKEMIVRTPEGNTKVLEVHLNKSTNQILEAQEKADVPTLYLDTLVGDFNAFTDLVQQSKANLLWNLGVLIEKAQELLNKILDSGKETSRETIMTLLLLDTADALNTQDPFMPHGIPWRGHGDDPNGDGGYGGGDGGDHAASAAGISQMPMMGTDARANGSWAGQEL